MRSERVVVIGAGVGGLVAALELAAQGVEVAVVERAAAPGGKMREVLVGGRPIDAGPTVFTMRWVFEEIFADAGTSLADHVTLQPVEILARHAWSETERLDLFADRERSAEAIGAFAGPDGAQGFRDFCQRAERIYRTLEGPFIRADRPSPLGLVRGAGLGQMFRIAPFATMWQALGEHFRDPRLRQLFGRYATYCGSSPFQAPATLMLVAHVEQEGVWLVEGGMHRLAVALAGLAAAKGATFHYGAEAGDMLMRGGRVVGVALGSGDQLEADAVVVNGDVAAVADGRFGHEAARVVPQVPPAKRSLSAVTWNLLAETKGFPLVRHTVFFTDDYSAEFADILQHKRLPRAPTVYVCAQDRTDRDEASPDGPERLLCLVNAPATGDSDPFDAAEIEACAERTFGHLACCGLRVARRPETTAVTTPADFARMFPATGGALYGQASHGWQASFNRPGTRTKLPGLVLAGGSTHPGPGVPMAALSGRLAARTLLSGFASTSRSRKTAMPGGMSTR